MHAARRGPLPPSALLDARDRVADRRRLRRVDPVADAHVDHDLRILRHPAREIGERSSGTPHRGEHLQRADQSVASGRAVEAQQVP